LIGVVSERRCLHVGGRDFAGDVLRREGCSQKGETNRGRYRAFIRSLGAQVEDIAQC
jgi:hypothetical protein